MTSERKPEAPETAFEGTAPDEPDMQIRRREEPQAKRRPGRPKTEKEDLHQVPIYMPAALHEALKWQAFMEGKSMTKWVLERIEPELRDAAKSVQRQKRH